MARELRKPKGGALYHLIAKGNQGDFIFDDLKSKEYFLKCLGNGSRKFKAIVYAYCIMGNHYHIMLQNTEPNLSELMHYIGSSFATYLRGQGRIGHIFSGRFKSIYLDRGERILYLSKYIHLNPVRAGIANRPESYGWSSYRFFVWDIEPPEWMYLGWLKQRYGLAPSATRSKYADFMENDVFLPQDDVENLETAKAIIKGERFLRDIMESGESKSASDNVRLGRLYEELCKHYKVRSLHLSGEGESRRILQQARALFIYTAREYTFANDDQIAGKLGDLSPSAVAKQYSSSRSKISKDDPGRLRLQEEARVVVSRFWTPHSGI